MKKSVIFAIAKKEFFAYINSALAYTVMVPFLIISIFLYLRTALVIGEATLRPYFDLLPWFLLILAPALSMKLISDEYRNNTLDLLFAHPVSELEIVLGKFFGALLFFLVILASTLSLPLTLLIYSKADPGQMFAQYLGAFFLGASFLALGLASSSFFKNSVSSFLLSAAGGFVLLIIGIDLIALILPPVFAGVITDLSILQRSANISRGVIDVRDIFYFLTFIGIFLTLAQAKLSERKLKESFRERQKLGTAFILIVVIGILSNIILASYPLRIDLTKSRLFSLSLGTRQTVKNLPDIVTVKFYSSDNLPSQMQSVRRNVNDVLSDYSKLGSNLKVSLLNPDSNPDIRMQAESEGVQEITFNKIGLGKFEAQSGFLGLSVRYRDKTESIPFIQETSDLEYQLTRRIRKLTSEKESRLGIMANGNINLELLKEIAGIQYEIVDVEGGENPLIEGVDALVIVDTGDMESIASGRISEYLDKGGGVLYLGNGVAVNPQYMMGQKSVSQIPQFLKDFGITLSSDLVFDNSTGEVLAFGSGNNRYLATYPFWFKALVNDSKFPPLAFIDNLSLAWPSSLSINRMEGITYREIIKTSPQGGRLEDNYAISPQSTSGLESSGEQLLGVVVQKENTSLVVLSSAYIAEDQFLSGNQTNAAFLSNTIDWILQDKDLASIPAKADSRPVFKIRNPADLMIIQYGNLIFPPLGVTIFAFWYLRRRRKLARRVYDG